MKNTLYGIVAVIIVVIVAVILNFMPKGYKEKEIPRRSDENQVVSINTIELNFVEEVHT
jgi:hypothetical protein